MKKTSTILTIVGLGVLGYGIMKYNAPEQKDLRAKIAFAQQQLDSREKELAEMNALLEYDFAPKRTIHGSENLYMVSNKGTFSIPATYNPEVHQKALEEAIADSIALISEDPNVAEGIARKHSKQLYNDISSGPLVGNRDWELYLDNFDSYFQNTKGDIAAKIKMLRKTVSEYGSKGNIAAKIKMLRKTVSEYGSKKADLQYRITKASVGASNLHHQLDSLRQAYRGKSLINKIL